MKLRIVYIFLLFLLPGFSLFGQVRQGNLKSTDESDDLTVSDKDFKPKLSLGVGIGFSNMWGNLATSVIAPAGRAGIGCRLTKNLIVGIEAFGGQLSSKESPNGWSTGFSETSTFEAVDLNAKITVGDYLKYPHNALLKILSGFFVGSGYGFMSSNITSLKGRFTDRYPGLNTQLDNGRFTTKSVYTAYIPVDVGLRIHLKRFFGSETTQFMLNYQINYTFSNDVSVYNFSSLPVRNRFNNCYTVITVGLSFHLTKD